MMAFPVFAAMAFQAIEPIALPLPAEKPFVPTGRPLEGLVITVDPGHGGASHTPGYAGSARGVNSRIVEQDLNMKVSAHLVQLLRLAGAEVHLTRFDDRRVTLNAEEGSPTGRSEELGARVKTAAQTASHLFLAVHHNSFSNLSAHGVVVLIWPTDKDGKDQPLETAFADVLREEVEKAVPQARRYQHYLNQHPLVTFSDQPSAVIEFGFLSNSEFDAWVSRPGQTRIEAVAVYRAIERFWQEKRAELEAERARLFPAAAAFPNRPAPTPKEALLERLGKPTDDASASRILGIYKQMVLPSKSGVWMDVRATLTTGGWTIDGSVSHPVVFDFLKSLFGELALFEPSFTAKDLRFGVVAQPMAMVWGHPKEGSEVMTQVLLGEPVFVLDTSDQGDHHLVHAFDGYLGWVRRDAVNLLPEAEFLAWFEQNSVRIAKDVMVDDFRIPTGSRLPVLERRDGRIKVGLPRGVPATDDKSEAWIPAEACQPIQDSGLGRKAAEGAAKFQGSPYLLGGRTELGIDCSGLTAQAWASMGIVLPRDAAEQAQTGDLVALPGFLSWLNPGDLLFFLDDTGKVFHVGISLGGHRFLHATPPEVQVGSLDSGDPLFDPNWAARFAFAKRPVRTTHRQP